MTKRDDKKNSNLTRVGGGTESHQRHLRLQGMEPQETWSQRLWAKGGHSVALGVTQLLPVLSLVDSYLVSTPGGLRAPRPCQDL